MIICCRPFKFSWPALFSLNRYFSHRRVKLGTVANSTSAQWLSVLTNLPLNDNKEPWPEAMPSFRGCWKSCVAEIGLRLIPAVENARMLMMQISQATELENTASILQTVRDLCRYYLYTGHQV